jgi:4-hydroxy-4-methyl-2-oxoglutarate aldolase
MISVPNSGEPVSLIQQHLSRLRRVDSCAISDAFDRLGLSGVVSGVPQQSGSGRIAGVAVTLKLDPVEPGVQPPRHLGTAAIEAAGPDNIIVVEQHTGIVAGCWGGLLTLGAKARGVAGVVADGPVRDIDEARALEFPIFAHGLTAVTARGRLVERATNVPVSAWGVTVHPGDYVIADGSAVVIIRAADIARVLEVAEGIAAREARMAKAIQAGDPISQVMGAQYESMLKG